MRTTRTPAAKLLFLGIYFVVLTYPLGLLLILGAERVVGGLKAPTARAARHRLAVCRHVQRLRRAHPRHAGAMHSAAIAQLPRATMHMPAQADPPPRAALAFIFAIVLLDVHRARHRHPGAAEAGREHAGRRHAAMRAQVFGLFGTAWALMQFLFSPVLGALSDRFGRRPVLLISMTGHGLDYILMALAPSLAWLFVGRVISGITAASFSTAYAYIADVTEPEKRAAAFGLVGAAFGIGFVLGPALGGLLGSLDPRLPFWVAAAFSLANAALRLFRAAGVAAAGASAWASAGRAPTRSARCACWRAHPELLGLAGVAFLYHLAHVVAARPCGALRQLSLRLGRQTMGLTLAAVGVASGIVQGFLIRPTIDR